MRGKTLLVAIFTSVVGCADPPPYMDTIRRAEEICGTQDLIIVVMPDGTVADSSCVDPLEENQNDTAETGSEGSEP